MATVRAAEPGALIALTGPRVVEAMTGVTSTENASTAEQALDDGLIDSVFPPELLRGFAGAVLHNLVSSDRLQPVPKLNPHPVDAVDAWEAIQRTREAGRPGIREFAEHLEEGVELRGDGLGADDPTVLLALGRLYGRRLILIGHDRSAGPDRAAVSAAGMRKAARGMRLAQSFGLPLVSIADTPGPLLDPAGEPGGIGFHIAAALADRARATVPLVCVLLGEGGGGAALAFLPAQYTIAAESAWLAPLPPEGTSAVLHRTVDQAAEVAAMQHVTSVDLVKLGVVDLIIPEDGDWMSAVVGAVASAIVRTD
jgi:acetyl-CoA carboxylase carboxyl transferase subunit beta